MAFIFDGATKRITLSAGTTSVDLATLYSRYKDWLLLGNAGFLPAFKTVGGDIPAIPLYLFLLNGWRIVPQGADHVLTVGGGVLEVEGGGDPFVDPAGSYKIRINRQAPGIAIGYSTGGAGSDSGAIAAAVRSELGEELLRLMELAKVHGLIPGVPVVITQAARTAGDVHQSLSGDQTTSTVARV